MSSAENSLRSRMTGLSRVKNGVIFHRATTINVEVTKLANTSIKKAQHTQENKQNSIFLKCSSEENRVTVQPGGVIKVCISSCIFLFLPGGPSWQAERHWVCPLACRKLAKLFSLEEHISKFLRLRKQMHLLGSVHFMGACVAPCTPGIHRHGGRRTHGWPYPIPSPPAGQP